MRFYFLFSAGYISRRSQGYIAPGRWRSRASPFLKTAQRGDKARPQNRAWLTWLFKAPLGPGEG